MVKPEVKKGKLEAYKAKYAPKPKEKIEPIKIEDNGKPIIAKDPAENDIAIAKLAKQDNPVEEPSIKAIEGKAEGDIKAKLNEVIAEVDDKIKLATRIEMVAMNDLKTDEASFHRPICITSIYGKIYSFSLICSRNYLKFFRMT